MKTASMVLTWLLSLVFIYAGTVKAVDTPSFFQVVRHYRLLPELGAWYWAHFLPWLEIISGLGLMVAPLRGAASGVITLLLLTFLVAITSAWFRGLHIECGCFAFEGHFDDMFVLIRDVLLLAASCFVLRTSWGGGCRRSP